MHTPEHFSLLCLAVIHGHVQLVKTLLCLGACQDNSTKTSRNSPIQIAACRVKQSQGSGRRYDILLARTSNSSLGSSLSS